MFEVEKRSRTFSFETAISRTRERNITSHLQKRWRGGRVRCLAHPPTASRGSNGSMIQDPVAGGHGVRPRNTTSEHDDYSTPAFGSHFSSSRSCLSRYFFLSNSSLATHTDIQTQEWCLVQGNDSSSRSHHSPRISLFPLFVLRFLCAPALPLHKHGS